MDFHRSAVLYCTAGVIGFLAPPRPAPLRTTVHGRQREDRDVVCIPQHRPTYSHARSGATTDMRITLVSGAASGLGAAFIGHYAATEPPSTMYALDQHEPDDLPMYPHRDVITLNGGAKCCCEDAGGRCGRSDVVVKWGRGATLTSEIFISSRNIWKQLTTICAMIQPTTLASDKHT